MNESPSRAERSRTVLHPLTVNGETRDTAFLPHETLLEVLRERMGLTGTKHGCELGECGTCTVLLDGKPVLSCLVLGLNAVGHEITTVEGLARQCRKDSLAGHLGRCTGYLKIYEAVELAAERMAKGKGPARGA
jgi:aerobic-type carbon monoxide dehydrogenase small subunit (CoxS/CutS family)